VLEIHSLEMVKGKIFIRSGFWVHRFNFFMRSFKRSWLKLFETDTITTKNTLNSGGYLAEVT
jgi:hypothetical protein